MYPSVASGPPGSKVVPAVRGSCWFAVWAVSWPGGAVGPCVDRDRLVQGGSLSGAQGEVEQGAAGDVAAAPNGEAAGVDDGPGGRRRPSGGRVADRDGARAGRPRRSGRPSGSRGCTAPQLPADPRGEGALGHPGVGELRSGHRAPAQLAGAHAAGREVALPDGVRPHLLRAHAVPRQGDGRVGGAPQGDEHRRRGHHVGERQSRPDRAQHPATARGTHGASCSPCCGVLLSTPLIQARDSART